MGNTDCKDDGPAMLLETKENEFEKALENLVNRHSMENGSDTPDFMLAELLVGVLRVFNSVTKKRDKWYKREVYEAALQKAIGLISTMPQYEKRSPDEIYYEWIDEVEKDMKRDL